MKENNLTVLRELEPIKKAFVFRSIVDLAIAVVNGHDDIEFKTQVEKGIITLSSDSQNFPFTFCFWFNGHNRFSLLIEDKEILDEYLTNEIDTQGCVDFVNTLLSNNLEIHYFRKKGSVDPYKKIYVYIILDEMKRPVAFEDKSLLGINLFFKKVNVEKKIIPASL